MHLGRDRARMRPLGAILRPEPRVRKALSEVLDDGERIPNRGLAINQDWHLARTGEGQDTILVVLPGIERDEDLLEGDMGGAHRQPWPHRPGGVVLVADNELQRHAWPVHWLFCGCALTRLAADFN